MKKLTILKNKKLKIAKLVLNILNQVILTLRY